MNYSELWGIPFSRISEYFSAQNDVETISDRAFRYKDADIELEKLPDKHLGSMIIAQTRVNITGGAEADDIHKRFYMRFLSAGG